MTDWPIDLLRPLWLLALVPWVLVALFLLRQTNQSSVWESYVDEALHSYVIEPGSEHKSWWQTLLLFGWLLALIALAGPVWQKQEVPVFQGQQAQVILFDLSQSMMADDIKPTRVVRARFKLNDFLSNSEAIQIGLIAFAERPYVISPLSDDANTIASFVESLDPAIMPAQGSRVDLAIDKGVALLTQAGIASGQLVLLTDANISAKDINAASVVQSSGHRLSVIGVGTPEGAPLRAENGQFLQSANGSVVVAQLKEEGLEQLAAAGGGEYSALSNNNRDLNMIAAVQAKTGIDGDSTKKKDTEQYWVEYAPYAVLALALMSLLLFRRGVFW